MADQTIDDLTLTTEVSSADLIEIWRSLQGDSRKAAIATILGGLDTEIAAAREAINFLLGAPPENLAKTIEWGAGNVYSVLAYGALADGSTDDTTAIQEAINAASAAGGGVVLLPAQASSYKVVGTLTLDDNIWLKGEGAVIDATGHDAGFIITALNKSRVGISGLKILAENTDGGGGGVIVIGLENCSSVWIENNEIDVQVAEDDFNTAAIGIYEDPASVGGDQPDFRDIFITQNVIRPTFLGILAQSRQGDNHIGINLHVTDNSIDYINIDADTQANGYGCGIKIDANFVGVVVTNNILDGRGFCRDGINVQEDITHAVVDNNIVDNFTRYAVTIASGQNNLAVINCIVEKNIIHNTSDDVTPNPVTETPRAIYISPSTNENWRNISVLNNIIQGCDGNGIYEDSSSTNRIINYVVDGNIIDDVDGVAIYVRSHRASVRNNTVIGAASAYSLHLVGSAEEVIVTGNRFNQLSSGAAIFDQGVDSIIYDNVINDLYDPGTFRGVTIISRRVNGENWEIEGILLGQSIATSAGSPTTIDLGIDLLPFGSTRRGGYQCTGEIIGGSNNSNVVAGTFAAWMRMTDESSVSQQGGAFATRSSTTILNAITLDSDNATDFQLKITSTNASESADNVRIRFRLSKSANL